MSATPYLKYADPAAALDWLSKSFGFAERLRFEQPDGSIPHSEMTTPQGDVVFLAGPGGDYKGPKESGNVTVMVSVDIEDVDAHHKAATEAGVEVVFPPTDTPQGMRVYKAVDLEGHEWFFTAKIPA